MNEKGLTLTDLNGNKINIDFNPIKDKTIDEYLEYNRKTYFQSASSAGANDSSILYCGDKKAVNVEYYDNSDIKQVDYLKINKLKFNNKEEKDIKNADLKKEIFKEKEQLKITNTRSKITAILPKGKVDEMVNNIFKNIKKDASYIRLKKEIIANVENIFENAIPILKHGELEEKNKALYDVQIIHRFALPIKIGGQNFYSLITVKERTDNNTASVEEFTIYDLYSKNITKKEMIDSKSQDKISLSRSQSSNISMNDLIEFVNAYLNKYRKNDTNNILFQSAFHGGRVDFDRFDLSNRFYQEGEIQDSNIQDTNYAIQNAKGFTFERQLFDGTSKENVIVLIKKKLMLLP